MIEQVKSALGWENTFWGSAGNNMLSVEMLN